MGGEEEEGREREERVGRRRRNEEGEGRGREERKARPTRHLLR